MKITIYLKVVPLITIAILTSCSQATYIELNRNQFSRIKETRISSVILKNGDSLHFNWDSGRYEETKTNDTLVKNIVGLNKYDSTISIPMSSVVKVYGDYPKDSEVGTVVITALFTVVTEFAILVALVSSISWH